MAGCFASAATPISAIFTALLNKKHSFERVPAFGSPEPPVASYIRALPLRLSDWGVDVAIEWVGLVFAGMPRGRDSASVLFRDNGVDGRFLRDGGGFGSAVGDVDAGVRDRLRVARSALLDHLEAARQTSAEYWDEAAARAWVDGITTLSDTEKVRRVYGCGAC